MIWYRHWIEMRGGLYVAAGCMAAACLLFAAIVGASTGWYAQSGRIISELNPLVLRLPGMTPARFLTWGAHTWVSAAAAVIVGIFLGGTGIRTNGFQPVHLSSYYTLTLPISRFDLIWTRFASACAAVCGLFGAMLVLDCAVLLLMREPVPVAPMAASSLLAALLVVPAMAVFGVLVPLWEERMGGLLYVAAAAAFQWAWAPLLRFAGSEGIPWRPIGAIVLVTGAALSLAGVVARKKDF